MNATPNNSLQATLLQLLEQSTLTEQQKVLDFALQRQKRNLIQKWDKISDEEAATLKAEFEEEDLAIAQANLANCVALLEQED